MGKEAARASAVTDALPVTDATVTPRHRLEDTCHEL